MKRLIIVSLLATLTLSAKADLITAADPQGLPLASSMMTTFGALIAYGGVAGASLVVTTIGAPSISNKNACKEIALRARSDIQEYNLTGELSTVLSSFVNEYKKNHQDASTEDALTALESDADAQLN